MIVVIDTNVWVSAPHFAMNRGKPRVSVEKAVREGTIAICTPIEDEILRILTGKFGWKSEEAGKAVAAVLPLPLRVEITGALHACRDPNDDMILECAVVAGAQNIVSGDKVLGSFRGIRILTPAEFLQENS